MSQKKIINPLYVSSIFKQEAAIGFRVRRGGGLFIVDMTKSYCRSDFYGTYNRGGFRICLKLKLK